MQLADQATPLTLPVAAARFLARRREAEPFSKRAMRRCRLDESFIDPERRDQVGDSPVLIDHADQQRSGRGRRAGTERRSGRFVH